MSLCVPTPVIWKDPKQGIMIGNNQMLLENSTAMCMFGGTIQIHFTLEAAQAACPFGSFKKPSEYIKDGFDWVFDNMNKNMADARSSLAQAGAPNWLLGGVDFLSWGSQFSVGVIEGAINAVVGLGEVIWDITQDPVGIGSAIVEGVADGAKSAWDWASKGENWTNAAQSSWDYVTSPEKWEETAESAANWVKNNPRTVGNVAGEIAETAAEIALTAGAATAARVGGKVAKEVVEEVVERGARELTEEAAEKVTRELLEKTTKEMAEDGVQKSLPKVVTNKKSLREQFLGRTPGKKSKTGREVIDRMDAEGKIIRDAEGNAVQFKASDGEWYDIDLADMAHKQDAVNYWNTEGINHGAKSQEVREWMLNSEHYELDHRSINRSLGGKSKERYIIPDK
jgi:hypothetical protein